MWLEIVCGVVIYKLVRRFLLGDGDDFADVDTGDSRLCFDVATRIERLSGGKAYVGLRIPDADNGTRQSIDVVVVTETELMVVAVRNFRGFVEVDKDGSWVCIGDKKHKTYPDPVAETIRQMEVLRSYLEQRGVTLPKGYLTNRVVLPNPYCSTQTLSCNSHANCKDRCPSQWRSHDKSDIVGHGLCLLGIVLI